MTMNEVQGEVPRTVDASCWINYMSLSHIEASCDPHTAKETETNSLQYLICSWIRDM
jgi:hypothetical protein